MKAKLVIRVAFISSLICLSVSSAYKKETNEKVKTKFTYHKDTLNKKLDQTEESKAMGELENESEAEQKESIIKDRIKRHLFKNPFRDRQQPIIIINRHPAKDPGNAWGQPQPTKGWAAPPPPTKGWTSPPPPTKGWEPPPPPPPTKGWSQPPPPPPPPTQGWNQPPPPPPKQTGWTNLQYQADHEREVSGGNSWNIDQRVFEAGARLLPSGSISSSGGAIRF